MTISKEDYVCIKVSLSETFSFASISQSTFVYCAYQTYVTLLLVFRPNNHTHAHTDTHSPL
jgi:hypothetical protein